MFEKAKNGSGNRPNNRLFILGLCAALAVGGLIGFFIKPSEAPIAVNTASVTNVLDDSSFGDETVTVLLTNSTPVQSIKEYSGIVTLLLTGTGQVSSTDYSDAFYVYMNVERQLVTPPVMQFDFTLEIDGESIYNVLHLSTEVLPYSYRHMYLIRYDAGNSAHRISFSPADHGVDDNSGRLQVTIFSNVSWLETAPAGFVPTPLPEPVVASEGGEMLVVPFTNGSPVYTDQLYSGKVTLLLRGTGQAGGADYSDAFYLYERGDHSPYVPPVLGDFAMELDGQPIHKIKGIIGNLPAYASDHHYRITYDVGPEPRRIGFRNTDLTSGDNSGAYTVEVIAGGG